MTPRLIAHPMIGLAYSVASRMTEGKLLREVAFDDYWQIINTACVEFAPTPEFSGEEFNATNEFCKAVRAAIRTALRAYGFRRVHVRSSDGLCDRTSNERAWVREEKWLASDPLPPGNHADSESRRLTRMRLSPERRREIARLGGLKTKETVAKCVQRERGK